MMSMRYDSVTQLYASSSKLLKILPSVWCNFSNLLKRKQSSRSTEI